VDKNVRDKYFEALSEMVVLEDFSFDNLWKGFFNENGISASLLKLFLKYLDKKSIGLNLEDSAEEDLENKFAINSFENISETTKENIIILNLQDSFPKIKMNNFLFSKIQRAKMGLPTSDDKKLIGMFKIYQNILSAKNVYLAYIKDLENNIDSASVIEELKLKYGIGVIKGEISEAEELYFVKKYLNEGKKVGILSRGYRGKRKEDLLLVRNDKEILVTSVESGDEAFLHALNLKVPVVVSKDRYKGAVHLRDVCKVDIIIMDDGFQHRKLKKDKNNIVIKQYLSSMYLKKGGNKNTLKAQKINEENLKDKGITDFEKWSVTGLYYYQIGEKKKAQEYFDKIKEKYKEKPAVYNLIEIVMMDIDVLRDSKNFSQVIVDTATNEKKMKEIHKLGYYHGDFNPGNFLVENEQIHILDTQGKKMFFGNYRAHYDMLTMKMDNYPNMKYPYPKNIFYYFVLNYYNE